MNINNTTIKYRIKANHKYFHDFRRTKIISTRIKTMYNINDIYLKNINSYFIFSVILLNLSLE